MVFGGAAAAASRHRATDVIYAGTRDSNDAGKLQQLAKQHSNIHVVQLRADSNADQKGDGGSS